MSGFNVLTFIYWIMTEAFLSFNHINLFYQKKYDSKVETQ